jgi:predicted nucleic acid-binding protein
MSTITLSTYTLDQGSIMRYPFQQALIYADACFILSLMDPNDIHHQFCSNLLLLWAHSGATLCYSNHVQHEVTHALLKMRILEALDLYEALGFPSTTSSLTKTDLDVLIDLPLVIKMHNEALAFTRSSTNLPRYGNGLIKLAVPSFVKHIKRKAINISPFYEKANNIFDHFISKVTFSIQPWYNLNLTCLSSDYQMGLNALELAKNLDLDSTDALHLSVAFHNGCNYFITKDRDLSFVNVNALPQHSRLVGAATGTGGKFRSIAPITGTLLYIG